MKYCPNCGEPLEDKAAFCPVCGKKLPVEEKPEAVEAPAEAAPAAAAAAAAPAAACNEAPAEKPKKKKSKAGLIIGIVALLLVGALAATYFTGAYKKLMPTTRSKLAIAELELINRDLDAFFEAQNKAELDRDIKAKANVTLDIDTDGGFLSEAAIMEMLLENISLDADIERTGAKAAAKIGIGYNGNPVLDATAVKTDDKLGVYIPQLDDNYYTIGIQALAEKLAENAGEDADFDLDSLLSGSGSEPLDEEKTRRELLEIFEIIAKVSTKENTVSESDVENELFGGEIRKTCDVYTVTPGEEELKQAVNDLADYLEKDGCYLAERLAPLYDAMKSEEEGVTAETLPEYLRSKADEFASEAVKKELSVKVIVEDTTVLAHRVSTTDGVISVEQLTDGEKERTYFSAIGEEYGDCRAIAETQLTDERAKADIKVFSEGKQIGSVIADLDMTTVSALGTHAGTVRIQADADGAALNISIDSAKTADGAIEHVIKLDPESANGLLGTEDGINAFSLKVLVSEGSGVSEPGGVTPTDLSDKSLEEIGGIFEDMFSSLGNMIAGMLFFG